MGQAASRQEAFWEACGFGHIKRVEKFIADGIDVNWVSYTHDCCPIHVASQGKPEIVRLLLEQNCDVNVIDIRGNTPLHHAAMKGHSDIMQTLISAGCKIDTEDKNGWTALHNAAYWCHYKAIKVLLKSRCDVSITNKDSRSALHEVARSKEKEDGTLGEIAKLLIEAGSDINARGSDLGEADFTGLMFASYHGHACVASAFIEAGCDLNACGASNNWSALHWAADRGNDELVYLLLEAGIDPTIKAYRGETAADKAKNPEVKETIINAINMFEELKGLNVQITPKPKATAYSKAATNAQIKTSPTKNKVTNQMADDIFSRIPPITTRPSHNSTAVQSSNVSNKQKDTNNSDLDDKKPDEVSKSVQSENKLKNANCAIDTSTNQINERTIDISESCKNETLVSETNTQSESSELATNKDKNPNKETETFKVTAASNQNTEIKPDDTESTNISSSVQETYSTNDNSEKLNQINDSELQTETTESPIDNAEYEQRINTVPDSATENTVPVSAENSANDLEVTNQLSDNLESLEVTESKNSVPSV